MSNKKTQTLLKAIRLDWIIFDGAVNNLSGKPKQLTEVGRIRLAFTPTA